MSESKMNSKFLKQIIEAEWAVVCPFCGAKDPDNTDYEHDTCDYDVVDYFKCNECGQEFDTQTYNSEVCRVNDVLREQIQCHKIKGTTNG